MKHLLAVAATGTAFLAAPLAAQDINFSYGGAANAALYSGGQDYTIEAYLEASANGFFGGIWAATIDGGPDDFEFELYAGYATTLENLDIALTLTAYFLEDVYDSTDLELALGYPVTEAVTLTSAAAYNFDYESWDISVGTEITPMEPLTLAALVGDDGTGTYWEASASYALNKVAYVKILYEDNSYGGPETVTLSVGFDF
ncbi:hypothetical protein [Pseudooceanicola sp.]|uniref:hypothetical protein n=1 Tax=Pseudooceanicola sp. TaxID=1914328 RepID=UPI00260EEE35|nr:hypothetical protein [Pseudooceanicola sp.]MDF1854132.1 hypothetical protein [Pseudooceanicola sp.]